MKPIIHFHLLKNIHWAKLGRRTVLKEPIILLPRKLGPRKTFFAIYFVGLGLRLYNLSVFPV